MQTHNIILIGPSGSGKTATAPILSEILGVRSCDTDELISVVCGMDGGDIISDQGVSSFRSVEELVVQAALFTGGRVLATGAGAWTIPAVRAAARQNGISVLLQVPRDELVRRLQHSDRVIVKMHGAENVVDRQLAERSREYGLADIAIDCAGLSIEQVARRVGAAVEEYRRQPGNDYHPSEKDNEWR